MPNPLSESTYTVLKSLTCTRKEGAYGAVLGISWLPDALGLQVYASYLTESEQKGAEAYLMPSRQQAFLKGRYVAKKAVAVYLEDDHYLTYSIRSGIFGQPLLETAHLRKPGLSISHSGTMAACVVFDEAHPMAIDVEKIEPARAESIEGLLSQQELSMCRQIGEDSTRSYMRLWSMKEALSKVLKTGLSADFRVLELEALSSHGAMISGSFTNFVQYKALSWVGRAYVWALVMPAQSELAAPEELYALLSSGAGV